MKRAFALVSAFALSATLLSGCTAAAKQDPIRCTDAKVVIGATRTPYNGYNLAPMTATTVYKLGSGVSYKGTSVALYDETMKRGLGSSPADGNPARISLPEGHTFRYQVFAIASNGDYSPCGPENTITVPVVKSGPVATPTPSAAAA